MSKFETIYHNSMVKCPYCGYEYQPEAEDYDEEEQVDTCVECGAKFYVHQVFSVDHVMTPNCELNGKQHDYQMVSVGGHKYPFCAICGKCKPLG